VTINIAGLLLRNVKRSEKPSGYTNNENEGLKITCKTLHFYNIKRHKDKDHQLFFEPNIKHTELILLVRPYFDTNLMDVF
jgi:hypothetical protein